VAVAIAIGADESDRFRTKQRISSVGQTCASERRERHPKVLRPGGNQLEGDGTSSRHYAMSARKQRVKGAETGCAVEDAQRVAATVPARPAPRYGLSVRLAPQSLPYASGRVALAHDSESAYHRSEARIIGHRASPLSLDATPLRASVRVSRVDFHAWSRRCRGQAHGTRHATGCDSPSHARTVLVEAQPWRSSVVVKQIVPHGRPRSVAVRPARWHRSRSCTGRSCRRRCRSPGAGVGLGVARSTLGGAAGAVGATRGSAPPSSRHPRIRLIWVRVDP